SHAVRSVDEHDDAGGVRLRRRSGRRIVAADRVAGLGADTRGRAAAALRRQFHRRRRAEAAGARGPDSRGPPRGVRGRGGAARDTIQVGSWYVLLDFATFLDRQLHEVWLAITSNATPPTQAQRDVVAAIAGATRPGGLPSFNRQTPSTLEDALAAVVAFRAS